MLGDNDVAEFGRLEAVMLLEAVEAYWQDLRCYKPDFLPLRQKLHGLVFGDPTLTAYRAYTIVLVDDYPLRRYTSREFPTLESARASCETWSDEMETDGLGVAGIKRDGTLVPLP